MNRNIPHFMYGLATLLYVIPHLSLSPLVTLLSAIKKQAQNAPKHIF